MWEPEEITWEEIVVPLLKKQIEELKIALQWKEDRDQYIKDNTPTNISELAFIK